ncbi:ATP-binding protein [Bosea sp. CCNWLW174]|uniref:ATP-binding protein n=1 Tax=unclassified Bosea (in: a-proteobacteria) TaxID=2653178 RepID=UPI003014AE4C
MKRSTFSERALILAPRGRDASIAVAMLGEAGTIAEACGSILDLIGELDVGAGVVVVTEEALATSDLGPLAAWIADQQEWSDMPFVLLTGHGGGLERNPSARRYLDVLGNTIFLERPFHPTTLVSLVRAALRGRRRQYEARARVDELRFLAELDEAMRGARDARAAMLTAATLLAKRLGASRCAYADVDVDNDRFFIRNDYAAPEIESSAGTYSLDLFGPRAAADMRGGHTLVVRDVAAELASGEGREMFLAINISAIVCCPLVKGGRLVAMMAVHQSHPRDWQSREIALVQLVVERCWSHIERVGAEARLRESEERLRLATEHADIGFWDVDPVHDQLIWPARVKAMFGISADVPVTMQDFYDGLHPDDLEATGAAYAAAADPARRALYDVEYRTIGKEDGVLRWVAAKGRGVFEGDRCVRLLGTAIDITARKAIEEQLRHLNETLEQRVVDEVAERTKAEDALRQAQKMEAVGQLTGGVAHDFNNLLTIIKSSTDLMRRPNLPEERRRRYVDAISDTVDRAGKLTGQLLAFARRQSLKPEVFEPAVRIRAIAEMLRTIMGSRVEIIADIRAEDCFVEADISQFETALVNMAVNARDAMDGEGTLTIAVEDLSRMPAIRGHAGGAGPFIAVSLSDTGMGIPSDKLSQIFEPFYTTKEVGKGTGLGLSQVFGFAKQSGGDIDVDSTVGAGTRFTLYLPRVERRPEAESEQGEARLAAISGGSGQRVLVVEDNVDVGTFSTQLLIDLGYETTWAANGNEALKILAEVDRFDAVFSDVVMPGMSGVELGLEIRKRHPGLPVVLTSGYSHVLAEEGRHGFELLKKPYAVEDLSRILRSVTRARPKNRQGGT